ncbi:MAG: LamG-like jellyroll fold domain-containing protein, partial [Pseudomonadota bacterium]
MTNGYSADGLWHHVVAQRIGDTVELYIDGVLADSTTNPVGTVNPSEPLLIGGSASDDFEGLLDDVRGYSRALDIADIAALYSQFGTSGSSGPVTLTVTNTNDSGTGSLRQAILNANANPGADTIEFAIGGSGTQVISLSTALPAVTEPVTIDATTQSGWSEQSFLPVVIDGNDLATGLNLETGSDGSEIRGLVIRDFGTAIFVQSDDHLIAGNWIGQFESDGSDAGGGEAVTGYGINTWNAAANVTVGGTTAADRNVIVTEGTNTDGIYLYQSDGWNISGNFFGTDTTGNAILPSTTNGGHAILTTNAAELHTIGGATDAHRNIFGGLMTAIEFQDATSQPNYVYNNWIGLGADGTTVLGNSGSGIEMLDTHQVVVGGVDLGNVIIGSGGFGIYTWDNNDIVIQGNYIGQNEDGSVISGNGSYGIYVDSLTNNITIGGIAAGEGNVITASSNDGIVLGNTASATSIRGNSIFGNSEQGIDLNADGVTVNDAGDTDTGPNNLQNWAVLTSAAIADDGTFSYSIDTTTLATGSYTIDFYASENRDGGQVEGKRYLTTLNGVPAGINPISGTNPAITLLPGEYVTLITTDASGNSSEFSNYAVATDSDAGGAVPTDLKIVTNSEGGLSINQDSGDDTYLKADNGGAVLGGLSALTFEHRYSTTDSTGQALVSYYVNGGSDQFNLVTQDNGDIYIDVAESAYTSSAFDFRTLADGNEHAIGFTWDNTNGDWALYVDGALVDSNTGLATATTLDNAGTLIIGNEQDSTGGSFDADIAHQATLYNTRIFDDVRTATEIAASYRSDLPYDESGMVAQWTFDNLSLDGVAIDTVGGNNLTVRHASESGFTASEESLTLTVDENALDGTTVGTVTGIDPERETLIAQLLADDPELIYDQISNKFYKYVDGAVTRTAADTTASSTQLNGVAGRLPIITTAHENATVAQFVGSFGIWLGASDADVADEWRWDDGSLFYRGGAQGTNVDGAYVNFQSSEPNGGTNISLIYLSMQGSGLWKDSSSSLTNTATVIEWDADRVLDNAGSTGQQPLTYSIITQTVSDAFEIDSSS